MQVNYVNMRLTGLFYVGPGIRDEGFEFGGYCLLTDDIEFRCVVDRKVANI